MGILASKRSKAITGGIVGTGIAGGAALAAILLTTTISGQASINTVTTSNAVSVSASSVDGSKLNCKKIDYATDSSQIIFSPVLTKAAGGGNASNVPIPGGTCTVTLTVENTGDTTLKVDGSSFLKAPTGWNVSGFAGDALSPIPPKKKATLSVDVVATEAAVAGEISGKLVYTDA